MRAAIAPTTRKTYSSAIKSFKQWRLDRGALPDSPATAQEACTWIAKLADSGLRSSSLSVYKSALHTLFEEESHPDGDQRNPLDSRQLKRVLTGIANAQIERRPRHAPSAPLMFSTLRLLPFSDNNPRDIMLLAAAALGVAATLRPSELLGSRDYPERRLTVAQLTFFSDAGRTQIHPPNGSPQHLALHLFRTKTHKKGETKHVTAPFAIAAVWKWLSIHPSLDSPASTLFALKGRKPLSTHALVKVLQRRHREAGFGDVRFTGKCFRRGGSSTLAAQGIDAADIASLGWAPNSPMWKIYANDPAVILHRALAIAGRMQVDLPPAAKAATSESL